MRRREFIALLSGAAATWPLASRAQKPFKIGLLDTGLGADFAVPFMQKLAELGYVEGRNVVIERKSAGGNTALLTDLAADLVRQQVDVIVTAGTPAGFAAKKATSTIPIVILTGLDPVDAGYVKTLARPGGNITGISNLSGEASPKHLELLLTMSPKLSRVAVMVNPANRAHATMSKRVQVASQKVNVKVLPMEARTPQEIACGEQDQALIGVPRLELRVDRHRIVGRRRMRRLVRDPPEACAVECVNEGGVERGLRRQGRLRQDRGLARLRGAAGLRDCVTYEDPRSQEDDAQGNRARPLHRPSFPLEVSAHRGPAPRPAECHPQRRSPGP